MTVHGHEPETFVQWFEAALEAQEARREAPFVIVPRATAEPIGSTRYMTLRPEHRGLEIGWTWHAPGAWGAGVNVEAKYLLLERAFEKLGCMRVEFKTDALNERARAALEALPARFEGIFRSHMLVRDGERRDSAWYAITDADWPAVQANLRRRINEKR
jgi:RimJ/RimL family protein N-acetyltransferase